VPVPLSTLLAQVLVAHTIELDNEFERRFAEAGGGARVTSLVMWSNLLRFVGDGISAGDLVAAVGLQKPRVLSALGGVERWRYVEITPTPGSRGPRERRDGHGSARGLKDSSFVRFTPAGRRAVAIWPELEGEVARRWRDRLGATEVDRLEAELRQIVAAIDVALPDFVPILGSANGMALDPPPRPRPVAPGTAGLGWLLAQTQMRYTLDFEAESGSSLPISENLLRVVDEAGVLVRDLPLRAGVSKEAIAMSLTVLGKTDYVVVEGASSATSAVRPTPAGRELQVRHRRLHARIERDWATRYGSDVVEGLRRSLERVLDHPAFPEGLHTPPGGWRSSSRYRAQTDALTSDPRAALPHAPMVLHRGGWPDGS
jgi:hypothetical protein